VLVGLGIGRGISAIYTDFFRFPFLNYRMSPTVAGFALSVSAAATLVGTLAAVRGAALLPPAVAMRPEPPPAYRAALLERLGLQRYLDQPSRMIVRHLERQPVKSLLSVFGISLAVAVMMVTRFGNDSIRFMMDVQFGKAQREDITLTFLEPTESEALYSVRNLPGVHYTEAFRVVEVELVHGHRRYRTAIQGYPRGSVLHRVLNRELEPVPLPVGGVLLTDYIADRLQLEPGDTVTAEVLDDARPRLNLPVAGVVTQYVGASAYMRLEALNRALREGPVISGVLLTADAGANAALYAALRESPSVAGVALHDVAEQTFYETIGRVMGVFTAVGSLLASTIAFGIVYNSARIALSERSRELASLRVLGYSKGEVAYILLGELALLTLTALPLGFAAGLALCSWVSRQFASELYRVPLALGPATYGLAASAVLVSAAISALLILRRVNRLDLIAVLKTRE
jgi:putative ABC transport system permease protein